MLPYAQHDASTRCRFRRRTHLQAAATIRLCMISTASYSAVIAIRGVRRVSGSH